MTSTTVATTWMAAALLALGASAAQAQVPAAGQDSAHPTVSTSAPAQNPRADQAQRGPRMDRAARQAQHEKRAQQRAEQHAKRQAEFQQKLNLNPAQQSAWQQYLAAMKPPARPAMDRDAFKARRAAWAKMSTPQRIDAMEQRHAERAARMKARGDATKAFYAQLNPAQQQVFDAELARRFDERRRFGHGAHGPHRHGDDGGRTGQPSAAAPAR
jgi:hypothetical protein